MTIIGVSITKREIWEGDPEEFTNVYHYGDETAQVTFDTTGISDSDAVSLVNIIADAERPLHANTTEFIRGRVWGPVDGTADENQTIAVVDLSGEGQHGRQIASSLEDTMLIRFRTGRRSMRDRPVWLRKWYRTHGNPFNTDNDWTDEVLGRKAPIPQQFRDSLFAAVQPLLNVNLVELSSFPDALFLQSPSGRVLPDYSNPQYEVYPYLQTHDVKY